VSIKRLDAWQTVREQGSPARISEKLLSSAFGLLVILLFTPWQQTSTGRGRVVAFSPTDRSQSVDAPIEARLGKWYVQEGSHVQQGDPIVELMDNDPEIIRRLKEERSAVIQRLNAARASSGFARKNLERQQSLFEDGLSSKRSVELAELDLAKFLTDEANASAELARIEVRLARQNTQMITAPRTGTILRRSSGDGTQLVKAGEQLAILVPETESRAAEIWVSGNDVPLISKGRKVRLQFEGWPAVQFSGWPSVAVGTFGGKVEVVDAADDGSGLFRVLVIPDDGETWPEPRFLRQGVRAHGWILLDQVKLGFEVWRRLNGFPMTVDDPGKPKNEGKK
jgi:multidrug efflux pump subunit AcrA (membrane-fusion protein)